MRYTPPPQEAATPEVKARTRKKANTKCGRCGEWIRGSYWRDSRGAYHHDCGLDVTVKWQDPRHIGVNHE